MNSKEEKERAEAMFGKGGISLSRGEEEEEGVSRRAAVEGICFGEPQRLEAFVPTHASQKSATHSVISNKPQIQQVAPKPFVATSRPFEWRLEEVPDLPEYHLLERTAVFVPHASPSTISRRISDVLRKRSIEASYEDEKAKVKCVTADGVDFRIRLYRGRGKFDHGIIVEVQRRFGTSLDFHDVTMAILDSAEGKSVPPPPSPLGSNSLPLVSDSEDDYQPDGSSSLKMVSTMLTHPGYDSHSLALQTLSSLTDSNKVGLATARSVSSELLRADNDVGSKVLSLVLDRKEDPDDVFKLRTSALTVLANAMRAVQGRISNELRERLEPVLIKDLVTAEKNTRIAFQAARCVEWLVSMNEQSNADLYGALTAALEVGSARHAGLEQQVRLCLKKIP